MICVWNSSHHPHSMSVILCMFPSNEQCPFTPSLPWCTPNDPAYLSSVVFIFQKACWSQPRCLIGVIIPLFIYLSFPSRASLTRETFVFFLPIFFSRHEPRYLIKQFYPKTFSFCVVRIKPIEDYRGSTLVNAGAHPLSKTDQSTGKQYIRTAIWYKTKPWIVVGHTAVLMQGELVGILVF